MPTDLLYTRRTLKLAAHGLGFASPQPLIGWIITLEKNIIYEGWYNGGSFIESFSKSLASLNTKGSTTYLNLNPIEFIDESNKLLDVLTQSQVKCLITPISHTHYEVPLVSNLMIKSIAPLQKEAWWLNRRFFTWKQEKRPYIILKWAETADHFIARKNHDSKWISNDHSRKLVHQWRSQEDAIMVGTNTYLYDNPQLNTRDWSGKNPLRIIIDRRLQLDSQLHVFDHSQPTICYNSIRDSKENNLVYVLIQADSYQQWMRLILQDLHQRQIHSLFIEGGAQLLNFMIEQGWWDEARVFQSKIFFNEGIEAPQLKSAKLVRIEEVSGDLLMFYQKLNKK